MRPITLATLLLSVLLVTPPFAAEPLPSVTAASAENKAEVLEQKAASNSPASATAPLTRSEVQAVDPAGAAAVDDAITCLSRTIYWEAKGEGSADMEGVANVVLNRVGHDGFPDTVCGVVKQGVERKTCQFSWWCDGRADQVQEETRYTVAKEIARKALNQQLKDRTAGALYFHDRKVHPDWARQYLKTAETEKFLFYRPRNGKAK
ncbi:cell wall hydrolase [Pseudomonas sp. SDI]|uniref:cell wall hydrolase n=1 Tax=Pseudomonas sp. SDI TaxID=2170734 RepID=UPI000DE6C79F|nr:cell wall hydrolase [Pseudomonas sp. SDI]PWB33147.1 cell wall hydrolase [Pseudomonas sp. SDI]